MTALEEALRHICRHLSEASAAFALVGGLAVSARTEPRFTRDADLAVAVPSDAEAERVIKELQRRGYRIDTSSSRMPSDAWRLPGSRPDL